MSLYENIHAKRKRIKGGSKERMKKKGEKGRPSPQDFKDAEVEILKKIYGTEKICIADGLDQLMRGGRANWLTQNEKNKSYPINLFNSTFSVGCMHR